MPAASSFASVARQVRGLSAGTLCSLTGFTAYTDLDGFRDAWALWCELPGALPSTVETYHEALVPFVAAGHPGTHYPLRTPV